MFGVMGHVMFEEEWPVGREEVVVVMMMAECRSRIGWECMYHTLMVQCMGHGECAAGQLLV